MFAMMVVTVFVPVMAAFACVGARSKFPIEPSLHERTGLRGSHADYNQDASSSHALLSALTHATGEELLHALRS